MYYESNDELKKEITKFLLDINLTKKDIADRIGISPQNLSNVLNKKNLSFADIKRILDAAGYKLEYHFSEKE